MHFNFLVEAGNEYGACEDDAGYNHAYISNGTLYLANTWGSQWTAGTWVNANAPHLKAGNTYLIVLKYKYTSPGTRLQFKMYGNDGGWSSTTDSTLYQLTERSNGQWVTTDNGTANTYWNTYTARPSEHEVRFRFDCGEDDPGFRISLDYGTCYDGDTGTIINCSGSAGCAGNNYSNNHGTQYAEIYELYAQQIDPDSTRERSDYGLEVRNANNNIQVDSTYNNFATAQRGMTLFITGANIMVNGYSWDHWENYDQGSDFHRFGAPLPPHNGEPVKAILALKPRQDMLYAHGLNHDGDTDPDGGADDMMMLGPGDLVYDNNNFLIGFYTWKHVWGFDVAHRWYINWKVMAPVDYIMEHGLQDIWDDPVGLQTFDDNGKILFDSRLEMMRITPTDYADDSSCGNQSCLGNGQKGETMVYHNRFASGYWDDGDPEGSYASHPFYILEGPNYQNIFRKDCDYSGVPGNHNTEWNDCLRTRAVSTPEGPYVAAPYYNGCCEFFACAFNNYATGQLIGTATPTFNFCNDQWTAGPGVGNAPDPGVLNPHLTLTPFVEMIQYTASPPNNQAHNKVMPTGDGDPGAFYSQFLPFDRYLVDSWFEDEAVAEVTPEIYETLVEGSGGTGWNFHWFNDCSNTESQSWIRFTSIGGHHGSPLDDSYTNSWEPQGVNGGGHKGYMDNQDMNWGITAGGHSRYLGIGSCVSVFPASCDYQIDCPSGSDDYYSSSFIGGRLFKWNVWFKKPTGTAIWLVNVVGSPPWDMRQLRKYSSSCHWDGYGQLGVGQDMSGGGEDGNVPEGGSGDQEDTPINEWTCGWETYGYGTQITWDALEHWGPGIHENFGNFVEFHLPSYGPDLPVWIDEPDYIAAAGETVTITNTSGGGTGECWEGTWDLGMIRLLPDGIKILCPTGQFDYNCPNLSASFTWEINPPEDGSPSGFQDCGYDAGPIGEENL